MAGLSTLLQLTHMIVHNTPSITFERLKKEKALLELYCIVEPMFATEFPCPLPNGAPGSALASIVGMQENKQ